MKSFNLKTVLITAVAMALFAPGYAGAANQYAQLCAPSPAFVTSLYHSILKRSPDSEGQRNWVAFLANGNQREEVIKRFFESPEYIGFGRSNRDYTRDLYYAILGREPDSEGHNNWTRSLDTGMSRAEVMRRFFESPEYRDMVKRCGSPEAQKSHYILNCANDPDFATSLYRSILKREPDSEGHRNWVKALRNGMKREEVMVSFFQSPEYTGFGRSNDDYVRDLYNGVLGRESDSQGLSDWVRALNSGMGRDQVLRNFIGSAEYQNIIRQCR